MHELPKERLTAAQNLFQLGDGEQVVAVLDARLHEDHPNVVFVTASGTVKRTALSEFAEASGRQNGIVAMKVADGDRIVSVFPGWDDYELLVVTANGQGIRFVEEDVRPVGRSAGGIRAIRLKGDDRVVGGCAVAHEEIVIIATEQGFAKRTSVDEFPVQARGGSGLKAAKIDKARGPARRGHARDRRGGVPHRRRLHGGPRPGGSGRRPRRRRLEDLPRRPAKGCRGRVCCRIEASVDATPLSSRRRWLMVAGAAVVVLGVVAIAFAVTGSDSSPKHTRHRLRAGRRRSRPRVVDDRVGRDGSGYRGRNAGNERRRDAPRDGRADVSVATSPTTRASQSGATARVPKTTTVQRRPAHQQ